MKRPECKTNLVPSSLERYETLVEHVAEPNKYFNQDPPLRTAYRCPQKCYPKRVFFAPDGDVYCPTPKWFRLLAKTKWGWIWRFYPHLKVKDACFLSDPNQPES